MVHSRVRINFVPVNHNRAGGNSNNSANLDMAKYQVTYKCGHTTEMQLFGKISDRENKIEWYRNNCDCPDCKRKNHAKENQKASEQAQSLGLVALKGSEKQIAWAETIRVKAIECAEVVRKEIEDKASNSATDEKTKLAFEIIIKTIESLVNNDESSWWIDNRNSLKSLDETRNFIAYTANERFKEQIKK